VACGGLPEACRRQEAGPGGVGPLEWARSPAGPGAAPVHRRGRPRTPGGGDGKGDLPSYPIRLIDRPFFTGMVEIQTWHNVSIVK
jgi:hypothetical protein